MEAGEEVREEVQRRDSPEGTGGDHRRGQAAARLGTRWPSLCVFHICCYWRVSLYVCLVFYDVIYCRVIVYDVMLPCDSFNFLIENCITNTIFFILCFFFYVINFDLM